MNENNFNSMNNNLRPFTGITGHEETMATIILYSKAKKTNTTSSENKDYLENFTKRVNSLEYGGDGKNAGSAKIPTLKLDGNNPYYGVFNNFSLQSVSESRNQLVKVHQNFGGTWNAFFLTEKPRVYVFTGFFLDSKEFPYYQEFVTAYDKYLKGRKLIEGGYEMVISYDGKTANGYLLSLQTNIASVQDYMKPFSFSVLVRKESWYRTNLIKPTVIQKEEFNGMFNIFRLIDNKSQGGSVETNDYNDMG